MRWVTHTTATPKSEKSWEVMRRLRNEFLPPVDRKTINARSRGIIEGKGGNPHRTFINERGLYTVVMRAHSTREGVEEFQQWVTGEVLPSIRKTGTYTMPGAKNVPPYTQ